MLRERLIEALGSDAVLTEPEDLAVYAFDAYTDGGVPAAVALPGSTREVAAVVKIANDCGQPIVARGAGTGLCGGAVPVAGGVVIGSSRMNGVL
jgi:glycolate oxidase